VTHELGDRPPPRPVLARRLAVQLGKSFSETISALIKHGGDVDATLAYFRAEDDEEARKAARCRWRRDEAPSPLPTPELPIFVTKSEAWPTIDPRPMPRMRGIGLPPPDNSVVIAELVSRCVLARAVIGTARGPRTVYASPGFARYLSAACGGEQECDDFRYRGNRRH
jgi:hypothetical protein